MLAMLAVLAIATALPAHGGAMANQQVVAEEVTFTAGGRVIPGTLTRPAQGRGPAVLLLAGSGPTDRNWNSPLIAGTNGSGRLLADALTAQGFVTLRFDKAFSGRNSGPPLTELSLDTYRTEALAALALLRARPEVDPARIYVAGHSEGSLHAIRLAQHEAAALRGVILLAGPGRSLRRVLETQLESNFRVGAGMPPAEVAAQMEPIRKGLDEFLGGAEVDPKTVSTLPQIQAIFANVMARPVAALGRALLSFEPTVEAARLEQPVLVLQGDKDVQVDPVLDTEPLVAALRNANRRVHVEIVPDADHVFKQEARPVDEIRADLAAVTAGYGAADRNLASGLVSAIVQWVTGSDR